MPYRTEEPITGPGRFADGTTTTHPAFGMIGASRVEGRTYLNGSDFEHGRFIVIRLARSEVHRTTSRDWHHPTQELFEVALSEAQWATFVSSMNVGSGVPCTMRHIQGEILPGLSAPRQETDSFRKEIRETVEDAISKMIELRAKLPVARQKELDLAIQELRSNLPFVQQSFEKTVEKKVEQAKTEINAYLETTIARAGIAALSSATPPLLLSGEADK